jgi:hypothetical protein
MSYIQNVNQGNHAAMDRALARLIEFDYKNKQK